MTKFISESVLLTIIFFVSLDFLHLTDAQLVAVWGIAGALSGALLNFEYIRKTRFYGVVLAFICMIIWHLFVQLLFGFWKLNVDLASFLACFGGLFAFNALGFLLKNDTAIFNSILHMLLGALHKKFTGNNLPPIEITQTPDRAEGEEK